MEQSASRREYQRWARVIAKLPHIWVDVMGSTDEWLAFGRKLKVLCLQRPAMQEEFSRALGDWEPALRSGGQLHCPELNFSARDARWGCEARQSTPWVLCKQTFRSWTGGDPAAPEGMV